MTTTITVVPHQDGTFGVQSGDDTVTDDQTLEDALAVTSLLIRCQGGDETACAELDARGIAPSELALDDEPAPAGSWS
jgi:hypothetical protein